MGNSVTQMVNSHEGPFPREPRKVESEKFPLEVVVERDEFAVPPGAEVPTGHVDVEHDVALAVLVDVTVVGHRDGQRALLGVVDARKARPIVCNQFWKRFNGSGCGCVTDK